MTRSRTGLTLTETLVSLAVVVVLVSVLVPAVQSVRESARRTTCQNNLRQIALAVQNHESVYGGLPDLYFGKFLRKPRAARDEFHFHSWRTAILPQLEQTALYEQIDIRLPATAAANQPNLNTAVSDFVCPSTSTPNAVVPDIMEYNNGAIPIKTIGTAARSDYEAIAGVNFKPAMAGSGDLSGVKFGPWGETRYSSDRTPISYNSGRFAGMSDGLSNTILIGERAGRPDWYRRGTPVDLYPYSDPSTGMDHHQAAWGISTHLWWLVFNCDQAINDDNSTGIFSFHVSGANVGIADGSVRFLSDKIDQEILNALVTSSAGDHASVQ
ncbi:DUF1559 domain-containing protein [Crateriforma conspicua]|uniref:DUF1559 domain-containing protein n=1 Tax=Crateriforma conspicua TaxID=2527996 RepID=A0A5C5XQY6_9PLAN|nr:DUF1559 domain-containing protein [Crateriforma conspicua]QDV66240.1 hypothetical protein Mal65_54160 [Crateriforma conspicua]TWT65626.1 hypothetical protein Pan14r_51730 [Crateriforma conspicua]